MNGNPVFADGITENTNDIHYENIRIKLKQTSPQHQMCHMSIRMKIWSTFILIEVQIFFTSLLKYYSRYGPEY